MMRLRRRSFLLLFVLMGASMPGGGALRPDADGFVLPDDLEITLWASSPLLHNPSSIDVDARGRVWVTEAVNYRDFNNADGHLRRPEGDRVVILEDTDGDGRAESSKVFVHDEALRAPLGVAVLGRQVVVSSAPDLFLFTDEDGDDRADRKEVLLTGFGGHDHDHSLHSVVAGPDGRWYFNTGNAGPHVVTDRAGWTLRSGSLYVGGSPYNTENRGAQVSDDGRVWVGGLALRVQPDGTGLRVMAHNFRNAYELAVDSFGDLWQNDNDDEVRACRVTWLMEGSNAGFFSADGTRTWQADRRPGQDTFTAHWHQEDPGVLPAGVNTGAGSPAGLLVYEGDALGPAYRGMVVSADAGRNALFAFRAERSGAGYHLESSVLLTSHTTPFEHYVWNDPAHAADERRWFRPSDVAVGPDGALYVADWYDPVVGGHQMHDRTGMGRIYRIAPKGRTLSVPPIDLETTEGQLEALKSPAPGVRVLGFERLRAQGDRVVAEVSALLEASNPYHRARAVWLLAQLGPRGLDAATAVLGHPDSALRITALRALRSAGEDVQPQLVRLAGDPDAGVRREVAVAARSMPADVREELVLELAERYDGDDRWYLEALGMAAEGLEGALYPVLRSRLGGPPAEWDARFAGLAWRLHPEEAVDELAERARSQQVPAAERRRAIDAIGFLDAPRAAATMTALAEDPAPDVAAHAAWWVRHRRTNSWRSYLPAGAALSGTAPDTLSPAVRQLLARATDEALPIDARVDAAFGLSSDPQGALAVLGLAAAEELSYQLQHTVREVVIRHQDPVVRALARPFFPMPPPPYAVADVLSRAGDPERGRQHFFARCAVCHTANGAGGAVGPDLAEAGSTFDRPALVQAIVTPSAAVAHSYAPSLVRLEDGRVVAGFVRGEGSSVLVTDAYGRSVELAPGRISSRHVLETSLMPDPDALGLSAQDAADVAAFLLAQERP